MLFCTLGFVLLPTSYVWANPAGEQVVGGAATFQREGNTLTVNQATDRLAVNWQSFNIAAGERTHFNMPSSTSAALNRVIGGNPSSIYGSLSANGILYLINPSGILVGPGGTVNAASFMASTLDVSTEQFMNAKNGAGMNFYGSSGESIINQGNITAEKGDVFLIAQKVENRGTINAANGTAGMVGSGQSTDVMVHEVGGKGFAIRVAQLQGEAATGSNRDLPDGEELLNEGSINAAQAELNASGNVYALAIRNSGTIRAKAVVAQADGTVRLDGGLGDVINTGKMYAKNAGDDATAAGGKIDVAGKNVTASPESIITAAGGELGGNGGSVKIDSQDTTIVQGKVDVAAPSAGAKGGKVQLLGERVGLFDGAKVDASGGAGGGTVLVGGDYLGGQTPKPELKDLAKQEAEPVKNAKATVMADTAEIKADSTVNGDGGKIIFWSDEYTGFYGKIFARGGVEGGDGGFVETSSKNNLQAWGFVGAGSENGARGHWLLDPLNVTIAGATTGGDPADISTGGTFVPDALNATVSAAQISTALGNDLNVTITTAGTAIDVDGNEVNQDGNITVAGLITSAGNGTLTLSADNRVTINSNINLTNTGTGLGQVVINANGENIILNATISSDASVRLTASGDIVLNSDINVAGATTATGGVVSLNAGGEIRGTGRVSLPALQDAAGAGLTFNAGGNVLINLATGAEAAVGDLGPGISGITTGGSVEIANFGVALSTLTANSIRATAGIELIGGLGNLILNGQVFDTGGEVILRSGEATAGIIIPNSSTRLFPKVVSPGTITFDGVVTLNAFDATDLAETGLTVISGNGINFGQSVNDGSISDGDDPASSTKAIPPTGNEQLLLRNSGVTLFEPNAFVGTARAITSNQATIQYLSLGPLLSFRQEGGSMTFQTEGTALTPNLTPTLGNLLRPNIYTIGSTTFDSVNLTLFENFFVNTGSDLIMLGTIDSSFADVPVTFNATSGGLITLDGEVGGTAAIGAVTLNAVGQIAINSGITTLPGEDPINTGADGSITLTSTGGAVVIAGDIDTRGGLSADTGIGGNLTINSGGGANQNIQIDSTINTRGGTMDFQDAVFFTGASTLDTTAGNVSGTIDFDGTVDGSALTTIQGGTGLVTFTGAVGSNNPFDMTVASAGGVKFSSTVLLGTGTTTINSLAGDVEFESTLNKLGGTITMGLGARTATFTGAVGGTNPFGMTVSSAGGIDFTGDVTLGGNFNLSSEGTGVDFAGTLNGDYSVIISSILGDISLGTVGDVIPIAGFSTSSGSGALTLNGDINTEGGALSFGQKVTITSDRTIRTGLGLSPLGASISFTKGVLPSGPGIDLTINPGSNGSIIFADGLGLVGNRFNTFTLEQGGGLTIGGASSGIFTTGDINILPKVFGSFPKSTVRFDSESGDITLDQGAVLTGLFSDADNNSDGSNFVAKASLGTVTINGVLDVSGGDNDTSSGGGSGYNSGSITITANEVALNTLQALGGDADTVGNGGTGGKVTITFTGSAADSLTANSILTDGGEGEGIVGGIGGDVEITRESALGDILIGTISSRGGDSADNFGGQGGNITITAELGDLSAPTSFFTNGGKGSDDAFAGSGGLVVLEATDGNISFQNQSLTLTGDGGITIIAGKSIVFATNADFTTPSKSSGGVVITSNEDALRADRRGVISLEYGSANTGGELYMPSSAYLISNGGKIAMDVKDTLGSAGAMTLSGISTSAADLNAGSIEINQAVGIALGNVTILGSIDANGGVPASTGPLYGRNGGSVLISGLAVSLQQINTSGSTSLATATVPAFGGSGGDVTITGTSILIQAGTVPATGSFAINTSGGTGLGTGNANGGSGGNIQLDGNVTLDSGDASKTTIIFNTQGGTFAAGGANGIGGNITVTGTLTGTETTSNILDLRYGSGTVTLGNGLPTPAADAITLGTLITAADDARSTGNLIINGELDLGTLTTYARGYSLSVLGGGTIENRVTFVNTGTVRIGANAVTTTFTDGFDALNGTTAPSTLQLGGTINTVTATTGSMLANTTLLVADTTLNSAGNIIQFGTLDGTFSLDLAAGVAEGNTTFSGAIGSTTEVGQITVANGVTGLVTFASTVEATGIQSAATSQLTFNNDVTLSGLAPATTDLGGTLTLNNQAYLDGDLTATLSFLGAGAKTFSGTTTLEGGPIEFGGLGDYTVSGAISGAQNLILSEGVSGVSGAKNFSGDITIGSLEGGPTITMSGGDVTFGDLTTANGIVSTDAKVIFGGQTTLGYIDTDSVLAGAVDLSGATLTSAGSIDLGDAAADSVTLDGTVLVNGAGAVNVRGTVTDEAGFTSFTQEGTAGKITFDENVTLGVAARSMTLNGDVGLSGMSFSTAGTVTLGSSLTDSITLSTAAVTLTGTGTFAINGVVVGGSQDLTLSGAGDKTFIGALSGLGTLGLTDGTGTFSSTVSGVAFNQSGGAVAILNGNGTFTGASILGGTRTELNGITFTSGTTLLTGDLISTEATTITGGEITLDTASAVTSSSGTLTLGSAVILSQDTTLAGAGAYQMNGAVNGAGIGAQSLTLDGDGAKTFSGAVGTGAALSTITQNDASGLVTFAEDVTMSGAGAFDANLVLAGLTMTSSGSTLRFGNAGTDTVVISGATTIQTTGQNITLNSSTALNSALILSDVGAVGGTTTLSGAVTGASSNLTITTDDLVVGNTVQTGSGVVSLVKKDGLALTVGGVAAGFLDAEEISKISTSGGLTVATGGDITIQQLASADTDQITGAFRMVTSGGGILVNQSVQLNELSGSAAGALTATGGNLSALLVTKGFKNLTLGAGGLEYFAPASMTLSGVEVSDDIIIGSVNSLTVNGSVASRLGNIDLGAGGDIQVSSRITAPATIVVDSDRYFINSFTGNPFQSADVRIVTSDLFGATWPSNGAVPGLQVVYGVNSLGQVGANQIGVSTTLLAGNGGPFILEFTTGTGQPYILAQQAAIPPVMLPATVTGGTGFAQGVTYEADDLEMMTPEERSAYESQQRQISARVILQNQSGGGGEEIGAPTEGRTPQAANPPAQLPAAPTAQVLLQGKPLAQVKTDQEKGDASKIIKIRPARAVGLREADQSLSILESERLAAEVSVGSAPVVQNR
jgi:filamentous hemagglutinin family protein